MAEAPAVDAGRRLAFRAGGRTLSLPAIAVDGVTAAPAVTRVPLAPRALRGLASVRGQVTPVVDVSLLLDADGAPGDGPLVMLGGAAPVGLVVERVIGLVEAAPDSAESTAQPLDVAAVLEGVLAWRPAAGALATRRGVDGKGVGADEAAAPFLAFVVGAQTFGLPLGRVRAIRRRPEAITPLPGGDPAMLGAADVQGVLLPVVSLRAVLGFPVAEPAAAARLVVVDLAGREVALLADTVRGIVRARTDAVEPAPGLLNRGAGEARVETLVRSPDGLVAVLTPETLLDAATVAALDAEARPQATAPDAAGTSASPTSLLRIRLGAETYGLPAAVVVAVVRQAGAVTPTPRAPPFLLGLMNHRGEALPLLDLRRRFGVEAPAAAAGPVVVLRIGDLVAGLVVDGVADVVTVAADTLEAAGDRLVGDARVFDRAAQIGPDGALALVIAPGSLLEQAERDLLGVWLAQTRDAP